MKFIKMFKLTLMLTILVLILSPITFADTTNSDVKDLNFALNNLDYIKSQYNSAINNVPGVVKYLFGNEKIQLIIKMNNGNQEMISLETVKGLIVTVSKEGFDEYTVDVNLKEDKINEILISDNQVSEALKALNEGYITYQTHKFKTKTKLFFSKVIYKIWR